MGSKLIVEIQWRWRYDHYMLYELGILFVTLLVYYSGLKKFTYYKYILTSMLNEMF